MNSYDGYQGQNNVPFALVNVKAVTRDDDIYVTTQHGDRLDNLAATFYGSAMHWWFIAHVNNFGTYNVIFLTFIIFVVITSLYFYLTINNKFNFLR